MCFLDECQSCCLEALILNGYNLSMDVVKENTSKSENESQAPMRLPQWLKQNKTKAKATKKLSQWLEKEVPNSICQEARCPNRGECFSKGVLTFMILERFVLAIVLSVQFAMVARCHRI